MTTGYEPLDTLKSVGHEIWLVDGPPIRFFGAGFPTRATVVRLQSGDIWVHSPTRLSENLAREIEALGPVAHLLAPNWLHYAYMDAWQRRFAKAKSWAAPGVRERALKHGRRLRLDANLGQEAPCDWAGQIDQMIVRGSKLHREAVFFHQASKTLILTDLIENFEPRNLSWFKRHLTRIAAIQDPDGQMPLDMRMTFRKGRKELRADIERMISWGPERIILAHGRWYDANAVGELRRAFRWLL